MNNEWLLANGVKIIDEDFEPAIEGIVIRKDRTPVVLYNTEIVLSIYMERDDMDEFGALEFFDYNIRGFKQGEDFPMYTDY